MIDRRSIPYALALLLLILLLGYGLMTPVPESQAQYAFDNSAQERLGVPNDVQYANLYHVQIAAASATSSATNTAAVDLSSYEYITIQLMKNTSTIANYQSIDSVTSSYISTSGGMGESSVTVKTSPYDRSDSTLLATTGVKSATSGSYVTGAIGNYGQYHLDVNALKYLRFSVDNTSAATIEIVVRGTPKVP